MAEHENGTSGQRIIANEGLSKETSGSEVTRTHHDLTLEIDAAPFTCEGNNGRSPESSAREMRNVNQMTELKCEDSESPSFHDHVKCGGECIQHCFDAVIYHREQDSEIAHEVLQHFGKFQLNSRKTNYSSKIEHVENIQTSPYFAALEKCGTVTKTIILLVTKDFEKDPVSQEGCQAIWALVPKNPGLEIIPLLHGYAENEKADMHIVYNAHYVRYEPGSLYFNDSMQKRLSKHLQDRLKHDGIRRKCEEEKERHSTHIHKFRPNTKQNPDLQTYKLSELKPPCNLQVPDDTMSFTEPKTASNDGNRSPDVNLTTYAAVKMGSGQGLSEMHFQTQHTDDHDDQQRDNSSRSLPATSLVTDNATHATQNAIKADEQQFENSKQHAAETSLLSTNKGKEKSETSLLSTSKGKEKSETSLLSTNKGKEKSETSLLSINKGKENSETSLLSTNKGKENSETSLLSTSKGKENSEAFHRTDSVVQDTPSPVLEPSVSNPLSDIVSQDPLITECLTAGSQVLSRDVVKKEICITTTLRSPENLGTPRGQVVNQGVASPENTQMTATTADTNFTPQSTEYSVTTNDCCPTLASMHSTNSDRLTYLPEEVQSNTDMSSEAKIKTSLHFHLPNTHAQTQLPSRETWTSFVQHKLPLSTIPLRSEPKPLASKSLPCTPSGVGAGTTLTKETEAIAKQGQSKYANKFEFKESEKELPDCHATAKGGIISASSTDCGRVEEEEEPDPQSSALCQAPVSESSEHSVQKDNSVSENGKQKHDSATPLHNTSLSNVVSLNMTKSDNGCVEYKEHNTFPDDFPDLSMDDQHIPFFINQSKSKSGNHCEDSKVSTLKPEREPTDLVSTNTAMNKGTDNIAGSTDVKEAVPSTTVNCNSSIDTGYATGSTETSPKSVFTSNSDEESDAQRLSSHVTEDAMLPSNFGHYTVHQATSLGQTNNLNKTVDIRSGTTAFEGPTYSESWEQSLVESIKDHPSVLKGGNNCESFACSKEDFLKAKGLVLHREKYLPYEATNLTDLSLFGSDSSCSRKKSCNENCWYLSPSLIAPTHSVDKPDEKDLSQTFVQQFQSTDFSPTSTTTKKLSFGVVCSDDDLQNNTPVDTECNINIPVSKMQNNKRIAFDNEEKSPAKPEKRELSDLEIKAGYKTCGEQRIEGKTTENAQKIFSTETDTKQYEFEYESHCKHSQRISTFADEETTVHKTFKAPEVRYHCQESEQAVTPHKYLTATEANLDSISGLTANKHQQEPSLNYEKQTLPVNTDDAQQLCKPSPMIKSAEAEMSNTPELSPVDLGKYVINITSAKNIIFQTGASQTTRKETTLEVSHESDADDTTRDASRRNSDNSAAVADHEGTLLMGTNRTNDNGITGEDKSGRRTSFRQLSSLFCCGSRKKPQKSTKAKNKRKK